MSLPVLAQHIASKGRNGDSVLVHMTPGEVHGLHALAAAHGGMLTVNPETGLVEASFLKSILPMIAGAALNFFLPGVGTAIGSALGGLSGAAGTAIAVGGITGLATGSLQKGLMAGLGAYGGAGLTDALLGGAGAAGAAGALGVEGAATGAGSQAAMLAEQTAGFGGEGLKRLAESASYAKGAAPSLSAAFSAGADAAMKNPEAFLKGAAKPLMYAAAPVLADQMVPTTTSMPSQGPGDTGYVRPFVYDPSTFGQGPSGLQALAPVAANQVRYPPPPGGANGGLVAFADGGFTKPGSVAEWVGKDLSPAEKAAVYNAYRARGLSDQETRDIAEKQFGRQADTDWAYLQKLAADQPKDLFPAQQFYQKDVQREVANLVPPTSTGATVSAAEQAALTPGWQSASGKTGLEGLNENIQQWTLQNPKADYQTIQQEAQKYGVDTEDIKRALQTGGFSSAAQLVATTPEWEAKSGATGLAGLSSNINAWFEENKNATRTQAEKAMTDWGVNEADVLRATGKSLKQLFPSTPAPAPAPIAAPAPAPVAISPPAAPAPVVASAAAPPPPATTLTEYERTAPKGTPPAVIDTGTLPGYTGTDKTYGGTDKIQPITLAPLGEAGKVTRGTETMEDVRKAVGNRYAYQPPEFTPSVTGASKSAYDYLMGKGEYPTIQTLPGGAPLWKPYVQAATGTTDAFVRPNLTSTTSGATGSIGFKPPTTGGFTTGVQRWRNTKTGEVYLAPTGGYTPPSNDWVLETDNFSTDAAGTGSGAPGESGNTGGQAGGTSSVGVTGAEGASVDGANGGLMKLAMGGYAGGGQYNLGSYSDGGRLLRGPGDGVSDSIPATIGRGQPARLADGEFVVPARIVSELGNGSTEAGARKLYAMMDRVQRARGKTTGKNKVAANTKAERFLPA